MKFSLALAASLSLCAPVLSQAATVTTSFAQVAGSTWTVGFSIAADGNPSSIEAFTVFFDQDLFADLSVLSSPGAWDSIVWQPDADVLQSPGAFDTLVIDPAGALVAGQSQGGFSMQFTYLGTGMPPAALPFDIVDPASYRVLYSGTTVAAVPEPGAATLALLGLGMLGALGAMRRRSDARAEQAVADEVAA